MMNGISLQRTMVLTPSSAQTKRGKLERKVIKAIYLKNHSPVTVTGEKKVMPVLGHKKRFDVRLFVSVAKPKLKAEDKSNANLSLMTAPDFLKSYMDAQKIEREKQIDVAVQNRAMARSLGVLSLIPKDLKPKFDCACSLVFKSKAKLLTHQRKCKVLAESSEMRALAKKIQDDLKKQERERAKRESKSAKDKKTTNKGKQPVQDSVGPGKRKRKQVAKKPTQRKSNRKIDRK
jgi:hypothetical protein